MTSAALARDAFLPHRPAGMGVGMVLALFAHALLVVALAFSVSWRSSTPDSVEAELWAAVPQVAAPPPSPPPPVVVESKPPPPAPKPVPTPVQQATPDAQIAIEKARREEEAKREEAKREERKREAAKREQARAEAERKKQEQAEKERIEKEAEALETQHQANLKRMLGEANATGTGATRGGTAAQSAGPSASYAGRVKARIKPHIAIPGTVDGNPLATVEVRLAPDGTIIARKLVKSSGSKAWDDAVLRAIDKTDTLPRDEGGRAPPPIFEIDFNPRD